MGRFSLAVGHTDSTMSFWDLRVMDVPLLFAWPSAQSTPNHRAVRAAIESQPSRSATTVTPALRYLELALRHRFLLLSTPDRGGAKHQAGKVRHHAGLRRMRCYVGCWVRRRSDHRAIDR